MFVWSFGRLLVIGKNFTFLKKTQSFRSFIVVNVHCKVPSSKKVLNIGSYEEVCTPHYMEYTLPLLWLIALIVVRQKYLVAFFRCVVVIETI